jgi:hypothetical protein
MVVAAVVGAERAARVLPAAAFSWRQAAAGAIGAAAALSLIVGTGWWIVGGETGPLARQPATTLPAYVAQEATGPDKPRTLVLRPAQDVVGYTLVRGPGLVLGDSETSPTAAASAPLDRVVGDLLSGRGGDEVEDLTRFGVRYVYLPEPVDPTFAERLDGLAGLTRASAPDGGAVWRLEGISARVTLRSADGGVQPVPSGTVDVTAAVPPDVSPRLLVLAESADPGWHATLGREPLVPQPVDGWAQGFRVPAGVGGLLTVEHRDPARGVWLALQGAAWLVVMALALPAMRRTGAVDDVAPDPDPEPAPPPGPVVAPDGQEPS